MLHLPRNTIFASPAAIQPKPKCARKESIETAEHGKQGRACILSRFDLDPVSNQGLTEASGGNEGWNLVISVFF